MKKIIGALTIITMMCLFLIVCAVPAYALEVEENGYKLSLTTDKTAYSSGESVEAEIALTNTSKSKYKMIVLNNVLPNGFEVKTGKLSSEFETLGAGESVSLKTTYQLKQSSSSTIDTAVSNNTISGNINNSAIQTGDQENAFIIAILILCVIVSAYIIKRKGSIKKTLSVLLAICISFSVVYISPKNVFAAEQTIVNKSIETQIHYDGKDIAVKAEAIFTVSENSPILQINKDNLGHSSLIDSKEIYVLEDDFDDTIYGTLSIPVNQVKKLSYQVKDDKSIVVDSGEISIEKNWKIENIGLVIGSNTITVTALLDDETIIYDSVTVISNNSDWIKNTDIDTSDDDGDGLINYLEDYYGTNKKNPDTDNDGINDYMELTIFQGYDPLVTDTTGNGLSDGDKDFDNDKIKNTDEISLGLNPTINDTDNDSLADYDEIYIHNTDPLNEDTDGDGANDGWEIQNGYDPLKADTGFAVKVEATNDDAVKVSAALRLNGDQTHSIGIHPVDNDVFGLNETPGIIGSAYDFSVNGNINEAVISFEFDSSLLNEDSFDPVIMYFNEKEQTLEALETNITGNVASASVTHFSKYFLINRTVNQKSYEWQDDWDIESPYTNVEIILVIDDSGSMSWNDPSNIRLDVARDLVDHLPKESKVGIVKFENNTTVLSSLVSDIESAKSNLSSSYFYSDGGTYMYTAINDSFALFKSTEESTLKVIVDLSDGDTFDQDLHDSTVQMAKKQNVKIYTVGLGYSSDNLHQLASETGGQFYYASSAHDLVEIYEDISDKIDLDTDSDGDGIPDYYEDHMIAFNGKKMNLDKNKADTDEDGLIDGQEIIIQKIYNENKSKVYICGKMYSNPTKPDTDGDGLLDPDDDNKMDWDVCDRDLAMFSALAYPDDSDRFGGFADERELTDYWELQDSEHDIISGFSAQTYKNGDNIVVAYTGTNSLSDWLENFLGYGAVNYHPQESKAVNYINRTYNRFVASNDGVKLYITGHSLGGYLSQIALSKLIINGKSSKVNKASYFNGIGMNFNTLMSFAKNAEVNALKQFKSSSGGNLTGYYIYGDIVSALGTHYGQTVGFLARQERIAKYHSSAIYGTIEQAALSFLGNGLILSGVISSVLAKANADVYYSYYNTGEFLNYILLTHELPSFTYYLRQGTRQP